MVRAGLLVGGAVVGTWSLGPAGQLAPVARRAEMQSFSARPRH